MQQPAIDVTFMCNDVSSLEKEEARGDVDNLVLVLEHTQACTCGEAIAAAAREADQRVERFLEWIRHVPAMCHQLGLTDTQRTAVTTHVEIMRVWMSGYHADPSTAQSSRSSRAARRNSASRTACRRGQTPDSVQSRSRRQAVTPEQLTVSAGTSRQAEPVRSTYGMPTKVRGRPGQGWRRGSGRQKWDHALPQVVRNKVSTRAGILPTGVARHESRRSTHAESVSSI